MNKEQAIAALRAMPAYVQSDTKILGDAIEILRALPDETPTVLTREKLDEMIDRLPIQQKNGAAWLSAWDLRDALLALGPIVVERTAECGYDNIAEGVTAERVHAVMALQGYKNCSDCGTRLQGGGE